MFCHPSPVLFVTEPAHGGATYHLNFTNRAVTHNSRQPIGNFPLTTNTETEHGATSATFVASPHYRDITRSPDVSGNSANRSSGGRQDTCGGAFDADQSLDSRDEYCGTAKAPWWTPAKSVAAREQARLTEQRIRADAREQIRWLHEKPWRAGKQLAALVRYWRQRHTQSIGRSRP